MDFPGAENQKREDAAKPAVSHMRDSQTDRKRGGYTAASFGPTSLAQEKENGGWTPLTMPVGGKPARTTTSSTRGWRDTEALGNKAEGGHK